MYWVWTILIASFIYALWNRGFKAAFDVKAARPGPSSPRDLIPDSVLRAAHDLEPVFEGDGAEIEIQLFSRSGTRGPAQLTGSVSGTSVVAASGRIPAGGWFEQKVVDGLRRGPLYGEVWKLNSGDPLGLFANRTLRLGPPRRVVLPLFCSLHAHSRARELEASLTAPRAGSGTEVFGIREFRAGDSLRRIHWRSSARRGELVVREFEPPGVETLGILCDPEPPSTEAADQIARIAASEAWDCLRRGGRVVLWAPGCLPTEPGESQSLWAALDWLARYPRRDGDSDLPAVTDAVVVTSSQSPALLELLDDVRLRGGSARAWAVGDLELTVDVPVQKAGLAWPI